MLTIHITNNNPLQRKTHYKEQHIAKNNPLQRTNNNQLQIPKKKKVT